MNNPNKPKSSESKIMGIKEQVEPYGEANQTPHISHIDERYEIINGIRYELSPAPSVNHQMLVTQICNAIYTTCRSNGTVLVSPIDVHFDDNNVYQPDVVFISHERAHIITPARIEGAPNLVVEILSPSSGSRDKIEKKLNYACFGVGEYWIVDPVHLIVELFSLEEGYYQLTSTLGVADVLNSPQFSCIHIDLRSLFSVLI